MPFSQSSITRVNVLRQLGQAFIYWQSTAPSGTLFQLYQNGQLIWWGTKRSIWVPAPGPGDQDNYTLGAVDAGEERNSFAASLPPIPEQIAELKWKGGTFEAADIAGFYVYGSDVARGSIDYATTLATITAYPAGIYTDGYGLGEYGYGGWGEADSNYSWESGILDNGLWSFAVVPFDEAGNPGTGATVTIQINGPPLPSPPFPDGTFLDYVYNSTTQIAVLSWEPSPSA